MRRVLTICTVACLMLSSAGLAWASPVVTPPPAAPGWWNEEAPYYSFGWWSDDILAGDVIVSPPDDATHWASNYLPNTEFTANIGITDETIAVNLGNVYRENLYKKLYIYITGTTSSTVDNVITDLDSNDGVFTGQQTWDIDDLGNWSYVLEGEVHPQPHYVGLRFTVPGMTDVTGIWAGEVCVPEPATITLLALSGLTVIRRRRTA